nr:hypothetical protein [Tanacetum cinerariifolium]
MVAYLTKSDASEGFNQVIDFLNGSYIKYALTVNPDIYVSCIKQFWNTVAIKQVNNVTRLQALVDKKKVVITEAVIREVLRFDDTEGVDFLPNEEIFTELARMGYEKPSTKLTFYIDFLSSPWKFLIHTILQSLSAKRTSWNKFSSAMARVDHLEYDKVAQALEITKLKRMVKKLEKGNMGRIIDDLDKDDVVALMDDKEEYKKEEEAKVVEDDQVQGRQAESQPEIYKIDLDHALKVLSIQEDEPAEVQEVVDVVTTAKLIIEVVTATSETITAASTIIFAAEPQVTAATITAAPVRVAAASTRRRKGVVIRDPEEELTTSSIIPADTKSKDKRKGIMVEEPKPLKKKQRVEMDEEYARKLHAELNKDITGILDYFKGMSYDDIPQKAAKRRKLNEEVEDLKRHLEIVPDEDDDVYIEVTPLERKVPVVDYEIINLNNKPYYKIIQADGTHQLYISFLTLLKNFDREDLEALWNLVKESAAKQKMMLLDSAAERTLMLLSQVKTVNEKCYC